MYNISFLTMFFFFSRKVVQFKSPFLFKKYNFFTTVDSIQINTAADSGL